MSCDENKARVDFVKDDMFTNHRGKNPKCELGLTETVIIPHRYNVSQKDVAHTISDVLRVGLKAENLSSRESNDIISALIGVEKKLRRDKLKVARNFKQLSTDDDAVNIMYLDRSSILENMRLKLRQLEKRTLS